MTQHFRFDGYQAVNGDRTDAWAETEQQRSDRLADYAITKTQTEMAQREAQREAQASSTRFVSCRDPGCAAHGHAHGAARSDSRSSDEPDSKAARAAMMQRHTNAWRTPESIATYGSPERDIRLDTGELDPDPVAARAAMLKGHENAWHAPTPSAGARPPPTHLDGGDGEPDPVAARKAMHERHANAWKNP